MTEDEQRKIREREEIAARVAAFRATQEKFKRERDEYFVSTLENARKVERPSLWPEDIAQDMRPRKKPGASLRAFRFLRRYQLR